MSLTYADSIVIASLLFSVAWLGVAWIKRESHLLKIKLLGEFISRYEKELCEAEDRNKRLDNFMQKQREELEKLKGRKR